MLLPSLDATHVAGVFAFISATASQWRVFITTAALYVAAYSFFAAQISRPRECRDSKGWRRQCLDGAKPATHTDGLNILRQRMFLGENVVICAARAGVGPPADKHYGEGWLHRRRWDGQQWQGVLPLQYCWVARVVHEGLRTARPRGSGAGRALGRCGGQEQFAALANNFLARLPVRQGAAYGPILRTEDLRTDRSLGCPAAWRRRSTRC